MARKRVKLQRILNDAQRRATFKKRLKGLTKKASELATLCGIDTCLVVYGEGDAQLMEVWPSVPEAMGVLEHFKAMPQLDRFKKMTNLEDFLKERIDKLQEELHKVRREADEMDTKLLLVQALDGRLSSFEGLTAEQLSSLGLMADAHLKIISNHLENLHGRGLLLAPTPLPATETPPHITVDYTIMEEPQCPREGFLVDVGRGIGSLRYDGFGGGGGCSTSGPNGDMVQPFNSCAGP